MELVSQTAVTCGARRGVASFPPAIPQNPYQRLLYEHLDELGFPLEPATGFDAGWLLRARRRVGAIHFHWPQGYYRHEGRGALAATWLKLALLGSRLAFARMLRYRVLWTVHQVYPHERGSRGTDRTAAVMLSHAAHALLVHDTATAERVGAELPWAAAKLAVVPHGSYAGVYPAGRSRAEVRKELGLSQTSVVFLAFGHVRGYKDLDVLLDGFAAAQSPDIALVVAGLPLDGPSADLVAERASADARIKPLLGFVPDESVAELFGAADAAVVSRGDGGTSGALILALSLETPAVVADARGYLDLIGDGDSGWTFAAGDAASLGRALDDAAADVYDFAAKREAARRAAARLSWPEAARRTAALISRRGETRPEVGPILLVASSGGHLLQLLTLRDAWDGLRTIWVSNDKEDARSLLADEDAYFLPGPYSRNMRSLLANLRLAARLVLRERPSVVLTTGADVAVPFAWVGRLAGARVVYVESFTRIETVSFSCKLIKPVAHRMYVQWPELLSQLPKARFAGAVAAVE